MAAPTPAMREALLLLHDAEARGDVVVWTSTSTWRGTAVLPSGKFEWFINGPTAAACERRGLLEYAAGEWGNVRLTDLGRTAAAGMCGDSR